MKWLWERVRLHWVNILLVIAVFSLYIFLFNDYFEVDPYGDGTGFYYALCATFVTTYLWRKAQVTK